MVSEKPPALASLNFWTAILPRRSNNSESNCVNELAVMNRVARLDAHLTIRIEWIGKNQLKTSSLQLKRRDGFQGRFADLIERSLRCQGRTSSELRCGEASGCETHFVIFQKTLGTTRTRSANEIGVSGR